MTATTILRKEHEAILKMLEAAVSFAGGNGGAANDWARAARDYTQLLRSHISKENNILFVMAEQLLSDAEQEELSAGFEKVELEKMGEGTHERLHGLMDKLCTKIYSEAPVRA
jgi:hemerythrin-like domain-containing protein